ncbi:lysylphosphatidylglycerol synthase transmembrane domain-containing protein [candidate division KSB1 bacterium]
MKLKVIIGILISLLFLYFAFLKVDFTHFWNSFKSAHYWYVIPVSGLVIFSIFIRAYRWKYLLILQKNIPLRHVFSAISIGYFANNVLPMRAGELIRAYVIKKNEHIPMSAVLATVLVERIIDVLTILFIAVIALLLLPIPHNEHFEAIKSFGIGLLILETAVIVFCIMLIWKREATAAVSTRLLSFFPNKIRNAGVHIIDSFIDGLEILKAAPHYFTLIWTSFATWLVSFSFCVILIIAFDIRLDFFTLITAGVVVLVFSSFAVTIPSSPGFVGTVHLATQQALVLFSIDQSTALGYAFLLHAVQYIPVTILGFYFFLRENIKFAMVKKKKNEPLKNTEA